MLYASLIVAMGVILMSSKAIADEVAKLTGAYLKEPFWSKYDNLFKRYGTQYGVDWKWLKAICMIESSLGTAKSVALGIVDPINPSSISADGLSWGLMQMRVETANDMEKGITYKDLNNPDTSVRLAAKYIAFLIKQFPTDKGYELMKKVVMSYNQGYGNTKKGKTYAAGYFDKFEKNMLKIK